MGEWHLSGKRDDVPGLRDGGGGDGGQGLRPMLRAVLPRKRTQGRGVEGRAPSLSPGAMRNVLMRPFLMTAGKATAERQGLLFTGAQRSRRMNI